MKKIIFNRLKSLQQPQSTTPIMWWSKVAFLLHVILLQLCIARKHHLEIQVRLLVNYVILEKNIVALEIINNHLMLHVTCVIGN